MSLENSLEGLDVLITRGKLQSEEMKKKVENMGGNPHVIPLLDYRYCHDSNEDVYLNKLHTYDWVIFSSQNAVKFYFDFLTREGISPLSLDQKYGVVGTKTKKTLEAYGMKASFVPNVFTGQNLARELIRFDSKPQNALFPIGNLAKNDASIHLQNNGWNCQSWVIYETYFPEKSRSLLTKLLLNQKVDIFTFTSSSAVDYFMDVVTENHLESQITGKVIATIGPVAKRTAENYGLTVQVCPKIFTVEKMMEELLTYFSRRK